MNKKQTHTLALLALVFGVAISPILAADNAEARNLPESTYILQGDLTAPNNDKPFGGENVGIYNIHVRDGYSTIFVSLENGPSDGMVLEGWLVDIETGEKFSTGVYDEKSRVNGGLSQIVDPGILFEL